MNNDVDTSALIRLWPSCTSLRAYRARSSSPELKSFTYSRSSALPPDEDRIERTVLLATDPSGGRPLTVIQQQVEEGIEEIDAPDDDLPSWMMQQSNIRVTGFVNKGNKHGVIQLVPKKRKQSSIECFITSGVS
jgi:hypothetical protein